MKLNDSVKYVQSIGEKRAGVLYSELNIKTIEDLLLHFPYKYIDVRKFYKISELSDNMPYLQIKGKILSFESRGEGRSKRLVAIFTDGQYRMELIWFAGGNFILNKYQTNTEYVVFGQPKRFGNIFSISHPEIEPYEGKNTKVEIGFKTFYNTSEAMKKHYLGTVVIRNLIANILTNLSVEIPETLPNYLVEKYRFISRKEAIFNIHLPKNQKYLDDAIRRLKFEELFYIQVSILRQSIDTQRKSSGFVINKIGDYFNNFYFNYLPFSLTQAQKRVLQEIFADLKSGRQMNRLLQGDVGSGKTIVALLSAIIAADNGFQSCIMAPTEILATQHYNSITKITAQLGLNIRLLIGATKKKERKEIHDLLEEGSLDILIGTHALLEDNVQFKNLGLVIIDEQHRFGVAQRAKLWNKNSMPPHILVMTATPIPRTLAMTVYGNLDISEIDQLPPGRKPIMTYHLYDNKRAKLYKFIEKQVKNKCQIYVVYPLIQESEKLDIKSLEDGYNNMNDIFPCFNVDFLHGKMKNADKDEKMRKFKNGYTDILMSTTVIEVGVDVPNASVMIIENAERFGLSQLHQLRGRVGRGHEQSYCILMSGFKLSDNSLKRLQIMTETNNGFEIAEADLNLRGPGEIEGTAQSGLPFELHIANLATDGKILQEARNIAKQILKNNPKLDNPQNLIIDIRLKELSRDKINWGQIS